MTASLLECREDKKRQADSPSRGFLIHFRMTASFTDGAVLTEI